MPRLPMPFVERLRSLRSRISKQGGALDLKEALELDYHDPLQPADSPTSLAVFEPVRVQSTTPDTRDTGWVIIVQETAPSRPD